MVWTRKSAGTAFIVMVLFIVLPTYSNSLEFDSLGRAVRNQLGTLYTLRHKLANSVGNSERSTIAPMTTVPHPPGIVARKESRGYAFYYPHSKIQDQESQTSFQFQTRMGRIDNDEILLGQSKPKTLIKWRKNGKQINKKEIYVNSFNIHQKPEVPSNTTQSDIKLELTSSSSSVPSHSVPLAPTTLLPSTMSQIQSLGQGINNAMTTVLTRKLMKMLDQDIPPGVFTPLKHLVASGNQMVEYWDKRTNARDGKSPGIVEMLGHGLEELKRYRDGQPIKSSDPVANLTSPARTIIQGLITVKHLTNRVLGYETENDVVQSRGGYGDSYGHGGYGHMGYGHYLDPYAILATLGFGVFLFNVIFNLLNLNNAASGRSLDVVDIDVPLALSDVFNPTPEDKIFGTSTVRNKRSITYENVGEEIFDAIVDKLDGVYKTYTQITKYPKCVRIPMCRLAQEDFDSKNKSILSPLYMYGLGQLGKERNAAKFIQGIKDRVAIGENVDCDQIVEGCTLKEHQKWTYP